MTVEKIRIGLEIVLLAVCVVLLLERHAHCIIMQDLTDEVNTLTLAKMHSISPAKGVQ